MPAYVCKVCGADVWAEAGREIRTSAQHSQDVGHFNGGLCHPESNHARHLRRRRPATGFTVRPSSSPSARDRWHALPLQLRAVIALIVIGLAAVASSALAEALDESPRFLSCEERIAC
jgi:hypothetical protein